MAVSLGGASAQSSGADSINIPKFFDAGERLEKPALDGITRLRFVTTVDFPPFNFIDQTGHLNGYNIDLIRAICDVLDLQQVCQIEAVPWDELDARLKNKEADAIVTGFAHTLGTDQDFSFSLSYLRFPARFMVLKNSNLAEPMQKAVKGIHVGVVKNTVHEKLLDVMFPDAKVVPFDDEASLYLALKDKKIQAAFGDGMAFSLYINSESSEQCCQFAGRYYMAPEYLGRGMQIAVSKDNDRLVKAFNFALKQLERDGKLGELYLRYFPVGFY